MLKTYPVKWEHFGAVKIPIGNKGENIVRRVEIDVSLPLKAYPDAWFAVRVQTPKNVVFTAPETQQLGNVILWNITEVETADDGIGYAQVVMYGIDGEIARSDQAILVVGGSIMGGETPPDPVADWLDRAEKVLAQLIDAGVGGIGAVRYDVQQALTDDQKQQARKNIGAGTGEGGVSFETDRTLAMENGVLRVNTTDQATENDPHPITSQGVYNEFSVIHALLKTI